MLRSSPIRRPNVLRGASGNSTITYSTDDAGSDQYFTDDALANPLIEGGYYQVAIATNRNVLPTTTTSSTQFVRHSRLQFTVALNSSYTGVRVRYTNWGQNSASEFQGPDNVNLKASIEYSGTVYACTWEGGNSSIGVPPGATVESDIIASLSMPAGATGIIVVRTVGAAGTLGRIVGHGAHAIFGEGTITGTDPTIDRTNGVYGKGALPGAATISGGNITAVSMSGGSGGSNYATGPNLYAYEVQPDGTIAQKTIGYGNLTAGAVTSLSITSGTPPAGVAAWVSPTIVIGNAFSNTTQVFGQALILAIPAGAVKSLVTPGDSIMIGFGSTDSIGDLKRNFGMYERALTNKCGIFNVATTGQTAANFFQQAVFPRTYALMKGIATHAFVQLGTNDVVAGGTKANLESNNNSIASFLTTNGASVAFGKLLPRTTGTFTTEGGQTPATGFALNGVGDQYNADVVSGVMVSAWNYIDGRSTFQGTDPNKWRVDIGQTTGDGIHPNLFALAYAQNNAALQAFFNVLQ